MFNKNGKIYMVKNIWQHCKQIWTHCFFVVSYDIVSYYRFLNTDPGIAIGQSRQVLSCSGRYPQLKENLED
jgi:hypothetical protein